MSSVAWFSGTFSAKMCPPRAFGNASKKLIVDSYARRPDCRLSIHWIDDARSLGTFVTSPKHGMRTSCFPKKNFIDRRLAVMHATTDGLFLPQAESKSSIDCTMAG